MVVWHIQTPIDQDLPLCRPQPGRQEPPGQNDLEDPILRNYIPANSIQGRNDGRQTKQEADYLDSLYIQN